MKMTLSKIPWADYSASPVVGCQRNCAFGCYADGIVSRFGPPRNPAHRGLHVLDDPCQKLVDKGGHLVSLEDLGRVDVRFVTDPYPYPFDEPTFHRYRLYQRGRKRPGRCFVGPMCDLWAPWTPPAWRKEILAACADEPWHEYLFLTKSPDGYRSLEWSKRPWAWLGATATTAEEAKDHDRALFSASHGVTFLSLEPWLGGDDGLNHVTAGVSAGILGPAWIILGPLNGSKAHTALPVSRDAVFRLRDACHRVGIALFVKPDAVKWGLTPDEIASMQGYPRPHPSER